MSTEIIVMTGPESSGKTTLASSLLIAGTYLSSRKLPETISEEKIPISNMT